MLSILYVDDDEDLLNIGRNFLEQTGTLRVDISRSAGNAFALMAKNHYDAIISDYRMPEMNGIAFLRNIRNSGNPVPFIMFTGRGGEEVAVDTFHAGADFYVRKEGDAKSRFTELARTVEKAVERKRDSIALEYSCEELKSQYTEIRSQVIRLRQSEMKYRRVLDEVSVPLLMIDRKTGTILDLNTASSRVYGYTRDELLGLTITDLLPESRRDTLKAEGEQHFVRASVHCRKNGTEFPVEVSGSDLVLGNRDIQILSVRDVTRTKMIENALRLANGKLSLLLGITRHDILNRLTALAISNEILSSRLNDNGDREILDLQKKAIQGIQDHIDFTREYDTLGLKSPGWQPLEKILWRSFSQFLQTISFRCGIRNLEVYADPMIEKVFYNLFDNAFRYGGGITEISVSCFRKGADLCILFRDDGAGIPEGEKERIFERGFGKNTGLGLFFSREILSITGMEIHETGEYRNGAQFEIRIPDGRYRFTDFAGESYGCPGPAEPCMRNNWCEQEN